MPMMSTAPVTPICQLPILFPTWANSTATLLAVSLLPPVKSNASLGANQSWPPAAHSEYVKIMYSLVFFTCDDERQRKICLLSITIAKFCNLVLVPCNRIRERESTQRPWPRVESVGHWLEHDPKC
ncbi:hypothetical protein BRADI_1g73871v3 [Brachypodium distachyon]|uniref:Uncharacterized protein n=1 Tax=Brachypodium distachyon TaxID=15368 RepID=A0A2K2DV12_BRADI|nr:hypothetical protein BRADI_1g73871v3 [Brachypodium distachyon]